MEFLPTLIIPPGIILALVFGLATVRGTAPKRQAQRRLQMLKLRHCDVAAARVEGQLRKAIAAPGSGTGDFAPLADLMARMRTRLAHTGRPWTLAGYLNISAGLTVGTALLVGLRVGSLPLALVAGLACGAGLPHQIVERAIARRRNAFVRRFPEALDLMVRGLRAGLPVSETLGLAAVEIHGPVGDEFKGVSDRVRLGRSMDDALNECAVQLGLPEFNFFCITLAIQRETGGNLAETLGNLADILRKRAQMKLKVAALSAEAKASAWIVGALPFIVFVLIMAINPGYMSGFFRDPRLMTAGIAGLTWLGIGALVMARMVSFEV